MATTIIDLAQLDTAKTHFNFEHRKFVEAIEEKKVPLERQQAAFDRSWAAKYTTAASGLRRKAHKISALEKSIEEIYLKKEKLRPDWHKPLETSIRFEARKGQTQLVKVLCYALAELNVPEHEAADLARYGISVRTIDGKLVIWPAQAPHDSNERLSFRGKTLRILGQLLDIVIEVIEAFWLSLRMLPAVHPLECLFVFFFLVQVIWHNRIRRGVD